MVKKIELECDWPDGADLASLDADWRVTLGPKLGLLFAEAGFPTGAVVFIEIQNDEPSAL